ncbi:phospholipase A2 inhibitor NAI-like [Lepidochelys kempii]|uniref:phospholipase A2 inhibitor NAI-like n=1 Tax=Lepidochelys kempii TaxID=8472 RepID=UPI003C6EC2C4
MKNPPKTPGRIYCCHITMQSSLAVCILAALLATGACLQCPHCEGDGTSCTGDLQTCPAGQNSCGVVLTETILVGEKTQTIFKGCATSSQCKVGFVSMNFGKGMMTRTSIACCMTESCTPEPVKVPPADTKPNGHSCPGCYAPSSEQCREETIACAGIEKQCVDIAEPQISGVSATKTVVKGCGTEYICAQVNAGSGSFAGIHRNVTTARCTPAPITTNTAPGPARLLFPALAGLLLLKFLS